MGCWEVEQKVSRRKIPDSIFRPKIRDSIFRPLLSGFPGIIFFCLFGSWSSLVCLSGKIENMEHWRNDIDRYNRSIRIKNLSQRTFLATNRNRSSSRRGRKQTAWTKENVLKMSLSCSLRGPNKEYPKVLRNLLCTFTNRKLQDKNLKQNFNIGLPDIKHAREMNKVISNI